jgi:hypothetical protein
MQIIFVFLNHKSFWPMLRLVFGVFLVVCLKGGVLNAQVLLENDSVFVSSQSILTDSIELQPDTLTPIDSLILIYRERLSQNQYLEDTLNHLKGPYRDIAEDISGHIRYQYNYDSRRDSESFAAMPPAHLVNGELRINKGPLPLKINVNYDPYSPFYRAFNFQISLDEQLLAENKMKEKMGQNVFNSLKDSLINTELDLSYQRGIEKAKLGILQDSLSRLQLDEMPDLPETDAYFSLSDSLPDTVTYSSKQLKHLNKLHQNIKRTQKRIDEIDKTLNEINNLMNDDVALKKYGDRYSLTHKYDEISDNSLGLDSKTSLLNSIQSFGLGTIAPDFSRLSTYYASIMGIKAGFKLSPKSQIKLFGGWNNRIQGRTFANSIKSTGIKLFYKPLELVEDQLTGIYNYRKSLNTGETEIAEINNPLLGLGLVFRPIKNIEVGAEMLVSNSQGKIPIPNQDKRDGFLSETGLSAYTRIYIKETSSELFLEGTRLPKNFKNYLSDYQINNTDEYTARIDQALFRSAVSIRLNYNVRTRYFGMSNDSRMVISQVAPEVRTRFRRIPNFFVSAVRTESSQFGPSETNRVNSSDLIRFGSNLNRKIKNNLYFGELSWSYRTTEYSNFLNEEQTLQGVFRFSNSKINNTTTIMYTYGDFRKQAALSNQFSMKLFKYLSVTLNNRFAENHGWSNGAGLLLFNRVGQISLDYSLNSFSYRTTLDHGVRVSVQLNF